MRRGHFLLPRACKQSPSWLSILLLSRLLPYVIKYEECRFSPRHRWHRLCPLYLYLIADGTPTTAWEYVRQWTGYYTHDPVTSVNTTDIRCNVDGSTAFAPGILSVPAGSQLGMNSDLAIYYLGLLLAYMAKVLEESTAANWDVSGDVWFKIFEDQATGLGTDIAWPNTGTLPL